MVGGQTLKPLEMVAVAAGASYHAPLMSADAKIDPEKPRGAEAMRWARFARVGIAAAMLVFCALCGFILWFDPYGRRAGPGHPPTPIMDINQRYMYPQLTRSGLFDSAVFGTSTTRLLDPRALGTALGGRFANLAINAGTPWEQMELARLFLRHVPASKALVLGLDWAWCDPAADAPSRRLTFRSFPPWLYDEDPLNDLPHLANMKTLEIAGRVALNRIGRMPDRIRGDGYEVFTPPEDRYDLARARSYLLAAANGSGPPASGGRLPAAEWLGEFARSLPATTRLVVIFPPIHAGALPAEGSPGAAADEACKRALADVLGANAALILDYRRRTSLTSEDSNFWDPLHYRLPIAAKIVDDIRAGLSQPVGAEDGRYRLLSPAKAAP